jgi:hypothetical protein
MPEHTTPFDWLSDHAPAFAAQESWDNGTYQDVKTYHLSYPASGPFYIACGIGLLAEHVRRFRFSPDVIQRLGQITDAYGRSVLHESFMNYLQRMHLTVQVQAAPEGTLLLPGEPMLTIQGPYVQIALLESALRHLCWESTHEATQAAVNRWNLKNWSEEDTPPLPAWPQHPSGWRKRAAYIGGADPAGLVHDKKTAHAPIGMSEWPGLATHDSGAPLVQIRRLFKGNQPLGDVWLTSAMEESASVSKSNMTFRRLGHPNALFTAQFSRFQNLYQPALVKGHPVVAAPRPGYFRQRTLKQMEAFYQAGLDGYPWGWQVPQPA